MSLLAARGLVWSTGSRRILGPIDLELVEGECLAIVGPNGAGKTTLLRLLTGLLRPTGGVVEWRSADMRKLARRELAKSIAYVPQVRPARVPLRVEQVVLLGRYPYLSPWQGGASDRDFRVVRNVMEQVGISALAPRRVDELSGGERQAVYIASALAQEAELLLLDEPTTHLDPRHQREVASLLRRLHRERGISMVFATHDLNLASLLADRVVALKQGSVLVRGRPSEVLARAPLEDLFEVPFRFVAEGERPLTLPELDS